MKKIIFFLGQLFSFIFLPKYLSYIQKFKVILYSGYISRKFNSYGLNSTVSPFRKLTGSEYISIGKDVVIYDNVVLTAWDKYLDKNFSPTIKIGNGTSIGGECHISAINKIILGENVLLGRKITLVDNSHGLGNFEDLNLPPAKRNLSSKGSIIIGDNVWVGDKSTILAGVSIGRNSIIGSNSVITKDVPPNSIVGGVPGKILKESKIN